MFATPLETYHIVVLLFACGLIVTTLEYLAISSEFGPTGIYAWRLHGLEWSAAFRTGALGQLVARLYGQRGMALLLSLRLIGLAAAVIAPPGSLTFTVAMLGVVLTTLFVNIRHLYGGDGSDQMFTLLSITLLLCLTPWSSPFQLRAGLWFIAGQAVLSYCAAGIAKLVSAEWRSGEAVYRIFNTGSYGLPAVGRFLARRPAVQKFLSWNVIACEVFFPLCLFGPPEVTWFFLGWGTLFHLLNAQIMGLNTFLWAFLATYPAILFAARDIRQLLS